MVPERPWVVDFDSALSFVEAWYGWRQAQPRGYSYGRLALELGTKNRSLLIHLRRGDRLGPKLRDRFAEVMGLTTWEGRFWRLLVALDHAEAPEERDRLRAELATHRRLLREVRLTAGDALLIQDWAVAAVLEYVGRVDPHAGPEEVARAFRGEIDADRARGCLEALVQLGYLERAEDGSWVRIERSLSTPPDVRGLLSSSFHEDQLQAALAHLRALAGTPAEEQRRTRLFGATLTVGEDAWRRISAELWETVQRISAIADEPQPPGEAPPRVFQLEMVLFPRSAPTKDGSER